MTSPSACLLCGPHQCRLWRANPPTTLNSFGNVFPGDSSSEVGEISDRAGDTVHACTDAQSTRDTLCIAASGGPTTTPKAGTIRLSPPQRHWGAPDEASRSPEQGGHRPLVARAERPRTTHGCRRLPPSPPSFLWAPPQEPLAHHPPRLLQPSSPLHTPFPRTGVPFPRSSPGGLIWSTPRHGEFMRAYTATCAPRGRRSEGARSDTKGGTYTGFRRVCRTSGCILPAAAVPVTLGSSRSCHSLASLSVSSSPCGRSIVPLPYHLPFPSPSP